MLGLLSRPNPTYLIFPTTDFHSFQSHIEIGLGNISARDIEIYMSMVET